MAKNDYKTFLKLLETTATQTTLSNKLADFGIDTEDKELAKMARHFADELRPRPGNSSTAKLCLSAGVSFWAAQADNKYKTRAKNIQIAQAYCKKCIDSTEPDWMLQARAAGWTPPKASGNGEQPQAAA